MSRTVKSNKGIKKFRSGFEKKVSKYLESKGIKFGYETKGVKYTIPEQSRTYIPDFVLANGVYIETKGRFTREDRTKMLLVKKQNPHLDIHLLFMRDNKIGKGARSLRYTQWAHKYGIPSAVSLEGTVPEEWMKK